MSEKKVSFIIKTEVPPNLKENLLNFIAQYNISSQTQHFSDVTKTVIENKPALSYTIVDLTGKKIAAIEVVGSEPMRVKAELIEADTTKSRIDQVKQDITIAVQLYEEKIRKSTLYFAWREGEEIIPEEFLGKERKSINRMFLETQIFLFVIFISMGMVFFMFVGWLAPILLMTIQLFLLVYSNKLIARTADWRITEKNPTLHILEYHLPREQQTTFTKTMSKAPLKKLKREVYEQTIARRGELNCETAHQIFLKYGVECNPENLTAKRVNIYQLVKNTADKFGLPIPEIIVSNTMIPNAATSGITPSRAVVLITTGLLAQLDDLEILSVLGHEFAHLKGHDPLVLYGLTGAEFLFRLYVLFPLFPFLFSSFLFIIYFWIVMTAIYFIAKFFEARADLLSAKIIGQPNILADALEKIGFRRLIYERTPAYRVQEWISLEPHPPVYFRVDRLRKLVVSKDTKQLLVRSARDVINGFLTSLG